MTSEPKWSPRIGPMTSQALDVSEIGSSFELVQEKYLAQSTSRRLPWQEDPDIIYLESGRQALAVVEAELRSQGHSYLHVPAYLCDSMIAAFKCNDGWTLRSLPVDSDLAVRPADLLARVTAGVLLHTPYFGRQDSAAMLDALNTLRQRGVVVVVDETHRVLSGPSQVADIRVASLRKMLPLYDGGYVTGLSLTAGPLPPSLQSVARESEVIGSEVIGSEVIGSEVPALRQAAMLCKSNALAAGDDNETHRALFAEVEHATEGRTQPARMSVDSLSLLHRLDLELIRTTRETNSTLLAQALGRSAQGSRFRVVNPPTADLLPFFLLLETDEVAGLRQYLAEQRIYCPVHWPPSVLLPRTSQWPSRYLSLPIDQRYCEADMLRMAVCVATFFAEN